jgi:hypothetical protein
MDRPAPATYLERNDRASHVMRVRSINASWIAPPAETRDKLRNRQVTFSLVHFDLADVNDFYGHEEAEGLHFPVL